MAEVCTSLMTEDGNIFSRACWPSADHLWAMSPWPIYKWDDLSLSC